jgi:HYR domain/Regulator of chromosome condensation (RCC1) repeat
LTGVHALALGSYFSCAVVTGGGVRCWGRNRFGQLGDGTVVSPRLFPVAVVQSAGGPPLTGAQTLTLGNDHACAMVAGGGVRCWGYNFNGQLGDGTTTTRLTPVPVLESSGGPPLTGVQAVTVGVDHSCALAIGSGALCWGRNIFGQLGDGTTLDRVTPGPVQFGPEGPAGDPVPPGDSPTANELPWATISALGPGNTVVLAGVTPSDVDLGGGTLPSLGAKPGVLAKYDQDGNYLRGTRFAIDGALYPASVVVASSGQIVVAATTQGEGGRQGWLGAFVEKESPEGVVELKPAWSRTLGAGDHTADKLAIDQDGNLFVAGTFHGSVTLGATTLTSAADGKPHAFVSKLSPDGAPQWAVRLAPDARSVPLSLAVDGGGNALLSLEADDSSTGLWKLSAPSGAVAWRQWGWHDGVVADANGDVYATGSLSGAYDFDVGDGVSGDFFVARYAGETGANRYSRVVHPSCRNADPACGGWFVGHTIALDQAGDVVVGVLGGNKNVINFGQGAFRMYKTPDAYVAAFSPDLGKARWSKHLPLILDGSLLGMQLSGDGRVMMTGTFSGSMMVDDRLLVTHMPEQPGVENTFLAAFRIPSAGDDDALPVVNELRMPKPMWLEATGQSGAQVFYVLPSATDGGNFGVSADCSPPPDTTFAIGTTLVECVATNPLGNQSSQSFTVTVVDNLGPAFGHVPASLEVEASSPSGATVTFAMPTAIDAVDGPRDVTCTRESGDEFAIGAHVVTCSAKDAAPKNNEARTMFGVTVVDKPPVLSGAPAPITIDAAGPTNVTFATPSALDHIDGPLAVVCTPESGSAFPLGTTQVVCSATDTGGNRAEVSFTVTVANATAPVISVPTQVSATAACNDGAYVSYQVSALDAIDGPVDVACSPPSGAEFPAGTTAVTCSASDTQGNVATASFPLRVTYDFGGVLQPVNADGSSLFKLGSTVAVKFKLKGLSAPIDKAHATLTAVKVSETPVGTVVEAYSNTTPDAGGVFNYDWSKKHYVYNLGTAGLSAGTWQLQIDLGDGVARSVQISLKN